MSILDIIKNRRAITAYKDIPVTQKQWTTLIEAASYAPSAGNLQDWRFIVVQEEEKRKAIAQSCHEQLWMIQAPLYIVACADTGRALRFYGKRGEMLYATQGVAAAIQNIMLTATDIGLATNWVGSFDEDEIKKSLGIPETTRVQAIITVGYANEIRPTPQRQPIESFCYFERWKGRKPQIESDIPAYKYAKMTKDKAKQTGGFFKSIFTRLLGK